MYGSIDPNIYYSDNFLVLDVETTNLNKGDSTLEDNQLLLACWFYQGQFYSSVGSEYEQQLLLSHIAQADYIVAHNVKFELGWLARCGYDLRTKPVYCTMIAHYVLSGNRLWPLNLNAVAEYYKLGQKESLVDRFIKKGVCPSDLPTRWLVEYCKQDVELCRLIHSYGLGNISDNGLLNVFTARMAATPILTEIERTGMCLDKDRVMDLYYAKCAERETIDIKLEERTGGINLRSNPQLTEFLFGDSGLQFALPRGSNGKEIRTPGGQPSCSAEAIARLRPKTPAQKEFIKLQKVSQEVEGLITKYLHKMQQCCSENEGILYANFNQCQTRTHRLSSSGKLYKIQLQNINRELKPLFKARKEGWVIMEADFAQLEFRVAIDLCNDAQGMEDIHNGYDIHNFTAAVLFDDYATAAGEQKKSLRTKAKAFTFRPLFGGGSGTKREKEYYKSFGERYKDITETQDGWVEDVFSNKQFTLETGLVVYYPDCRMDSRGYISEQTKIRNLPIQNFASAEIVLLSLVKLWEELEPYESFIVSTVHDSIILEVHPDEVEEVTRLCKRIMEKDIVFILKELYNYTVKVPLEVDVETSHHWGEYG